MCKHIAVNNWWRYQHYKERRPVWVKLHVTYLEDKKDWPADQRLIALLLMIVAANKDNRFTSSASWLSEELGLPVAAVKRSVAALLEDGFLRDADAPDSEQPGSKPASREASEEASGDASDLAMPTRVSSPLLDLPVNDEGIAKGSGKPKGTKERNNALWDALTAAFGFDAKMPTAASLRGKVVRELASVGATPEEVARRVERHRKTNDWTLTEQSLLKWWDSLAAPVVERPAWIDEIGRPDVRAEVEKLPNLRPTKPGWWWQVEPGPEHIDVDPMSVSDVVRLLTRDAA